MDSSVHSVSSSDSPFPTDDPLAAGSAFCFCRAITQGRYAERPLEDVMTELEAIREREIYIVDDDFLVDLELSALQAEGRGEVISSPRVITANQKEASIRQGVEIPYQEAASSGATTTQFKEAVLSLTVTPQITPDDRIIMDLLAAEMRAVTGKPVKRATGLEPATFSLEG